MPRQPTPDAELAELDRLEAEFRASQTERKTTADNSNLFLAPPPRTVPLTLALKIFFTPKDIWIMLCLLSFFLGLNLITIGVERSINSPEFAAASAVSAAGADMPYQTKPPLSFGNTALLIISGLFVLVTLSRFIRCLLETKKEYRLLRLGMAAEASFTEGRDTSSRRIDGMPLLSYTYKLNAPNGVYYATRQTYTFFNHARPALVLYDPDNPKTNALYNIPGYTLTADTAGNPAGPGITLVRYMVLPVIALTLLGFVLYGYADVIKNALG